MHYIKITDNSIFFEGLKNQLLSENSNAVCDEKYILCGLDEKNSEVIADVISDYIWDVKFLDYVTRKTRCEQDCIQEIDIIINTMNVANSFKENNDTVKERISEYMNSNKEINIDGFVNFRLRDFLNDFDNLINFYKKSYDVEAEYFDFICTLKECMNYIEPQGEAEVHIINCGGKSYILNADGEDITETAIKEYTFPMDESNGITRDDMIVSTLISMSPRVVHLHSNKYCSTPVLFDTLKAIFACRIIVE